MADTPNLFKRNQTFQKGFSLFESLITIGLMAIFLTMSFINFREGENRVSLQRAGTEVAQDIRRAQEMALSGATCPGCTNEPNGYGIVFDLKTSSSSYLIYADTVPVPQGNDFYVGDYIIEEIEMEKGVIIKELLIDSISVDKLCVNFHPPVPEVAIKEKQNDDDKTTGEIIISLASDPEQTKRITVGKGGFIDVQ